MDVTVIGTGAMGTAVVESLLDKGHNVTVFNRTAANAEQSAAKGAAVSETVGSAIQASSVVISVVVDAAALDALVLRSEILPLFGGRTFIKMTTTNGRQAREIARTIQAAGGSCLELAILNFPDEVRRGAMHAMVGGAEDEFARWAQLLDDLGPKMLRVGDIGAASIAENAMLQIMMFQLVAFSYGLAVFDRAGLPQDVFVDATRENPLFQIPLGEYFVGRMQGDDFDPALYRLVKHASDMQLTLDDMEELGIVTDALRAARDLLVRGVEQGRGEQDYTSVYKVISPDPDG